MKSKQEDIMLIDNILADDYEAQKEFYNKYRTILNDYLSSKYPNNWDIEDDVSEILIKIFTNLYKFDAERASVKTWAFAIAKNHMIDKSRCNNVLQGTITIDGADIDFMTDITTSDCTLYLGDDVNISYTNGSYIADFENCNAIAFVSNHLETSDFSYLDMHYNHGYTYCEIATEFNISSTTISNRVNYLKSKLKNTIDKEAVIE